jgi:excinuclease UvrABC helicase subunit UvrB
MGRSLLFRRASEFEPGGDHPEAFRELDAGLREGRKHQIRLGIRGSGNLFTMTKQVLPAAARRVEELPALRDRMKHLQKVLVLATA